MGTLHPSPQQDDHADTREKKIDPKITGTGTGDRKTGTAPEALVSARKPLLQPTNTSPIPERVPDRVPA
eukprot:2548130-Prymnesium_polylepis.1